jgi:DNA helicase HerA-like ATPase
MTVAIEMGHTTAGAPATLDLEELLATRLLVQGNSGSGKSHLLRRLLEQSAPWVQQTIIDPEGDFVALADRFGHLLIDAEDHTERGLQVAGERARIHRVSAVLNLEGLDAENQMRRAAAFLSGLFEPARDHWYPMLVVVDEAQLFAPAVAGEVSDEARKLSLGAMTNLMCRGRKRGLAGVIATQRRRSSPRTSRPRRPISSWAEPFWISTWRAPPTFWAWNGDRQRPSGIWSAGNSWRWDRPSPAVRWGCALAPRIPRRATRPRA